MLPILTDSSAFLGQEVIYNGYFSIVNDVSGDINLAFDHLYDHGNYSSLI